MIQEEVPMNLALDGLQPDVGHEVFWVLKARLL
jgi:hypothetical protein